MWTFTQLYLHYSRHFSFNLPVVLAIHSSLPDTNYWFTRKSVTMHKTFVFGVFPRNIPNQTPFVIYETSFVVLQKQTNLTNLKVEKNHWKSQIQKKIFNNIY